MDWQKFFDVLSDNILQPLLMIVATALVTIIMSFVKKFVTSVINKNNASATNELTAAKANILKELEIITDSAVSATMNMADELKNQYGKLTEEQITKLQENAKKIIYNGLPDNLKTNGGSWLELLGGEAQLSTIIDSLIEKFVIEEKSKISSITKQSADEKK